MPRPAPFLAAAACLLGAPLIAHFGILVPQKDVIDPGVESSIRLSAAFGHPADGELLGGAAPSAVGVVIEGEHQDLSEHLQLHDEDGKAWWSLDFAISTPGDHIFYLNPTPYWEPAEDIYIAHYVKTLVTVGDGGEGWQEALGSEITPAELVPLTRPNAMCAGNSIRAQVLYHGQAVAGAMVEVERLHWQDRSGRALNPPTPLHETQELVSDEHGIISFTPPASGWWGISALIEDEHQEAITGSALSITHPELGEKAVEVGAVLWFYAYPLAWADE